MGDRGNIAIIQSSSNGHVAQVWLYSHWLGSDLPQCLQQALVAGKNRWQDESYLAKIIVWHAFGQSVLEAETGAGVSTRLQDNEHDILVVDVPKQRVFTMKESELEDGQIPALFETRQFYSFDEYAALTKLPEI